MAIVTNTATTFGLKGIREDLTDIIWNVSPMETPFTSSIERGTAEQTFHEWQTDALDAADNTNAQLEGDDVSSFDSVTATARLGNYCQISRKTVVISRTSDRVRKAGRKSEMAYQIMKKGKALRLDIEKILVGTNQARVAGNNTTARKSASVLSWIKTNTDKASDGSNPSAADGTGTRTDGTARPFVESSLKSVAKQVYASSGQAPDLLMVPPTQKQVASTFTGNATRTIDAEDKKLVAAIDVYVGDFGSLRIIPNRLMRSSDALVLNTDLWKLCWLDPIKRAPLAKTGDAEKVMLIGEYTLEASNEAGSGGVFDIA